MSPSLVALASASNGSFRNARRNERIVPLKFAKSWAAFTAALLTTYKLAEHGVTYEEGGVLLSAWLGVAAVYAIPNKENE